MRYVLWFLAFTAALVSNSHADPIKLSPKGTYDSIFEADRNGTFLAFSKSEHQLVLFRCDSKTCTPENKMEIADNVWKVASVPSGFAVATGYGPQKMDAPIKVTLVSKTLTNPKQIYEVKSERGEVGSLKFADGKLWISYFESKYYAVTGYFELENSQFHKEATERLGSNIDVIGNLLVVGRVYGEPQGQDGDLLLFKDGKREVLPTYRGVRSVKLIPGAENKWPEILIGDGWQQNYKEFGQARLSVLSYDDKFKRYGLFLIDNDKDQFSISKIERLNSGKVIALGDKRINIYDPSKEWERSALVEKASELTQLDFVVVNEGAAVMYAVLNDDLTFVVQ